MNFCTGNAFEYIEYFNNSLTNLMYETNIYVKARLKQIFIIQHLTNSSNIDVKNYTYILKLYKPIFFIYFDFVDESISMLDSQVG